MCLLPPNCLFCAHYHIEAGDNEDDCDAFAEIPDSIFVGGLTHQSAYQGDHGIRFQLNDDLADEFEEVEALRETIKTSS
jgi:hypothetical protein